MRHTLIDVRLSGRGRLVTKMSSIRILLVDDFQPFRRLVSSILQKDSRLQVVGEASDGVEAVQKAKELRPDLILLDVGLPKLNGVEAARRIRQSTPQSKILFLSQETSSAVIQEALSLGAWGYLAKTQARELLSAAVDAISRDERFVNDGFVHDLSAASADMPAEIRD